MKIDKNEIVQVFDSRKGTFRARAKEAFDTDDNEFYPLITLEYVEGLSSEWFPGEEIPVRKGISLVKKIEGGTES